MTANAAANISYYYLYNEITKQLQILSYNLINIKEDALKEINQNKNGIQEELDIRMRRKIKECIIHHQQIFS